MTMESWYLLFLAAALGCGWYLGFKTKQRKDSNNPTNLPRDYLLGLNFLINEEPDKAVDVLIKMLEVDSNTVETHLAVGSLFRRRGEFDRAIRIHQNLIARPNLDKKFRDKSLYELGQDYLSAGVLDRAERIFLEVLDIKSYSAKASSALLDIYQQEKEWENAIQMAYKVESLTKKNMQHIIAHYFCELADIEFDNNNLSKGHNYLKQAFVADSSCVRASILQAKLFISSGDHKGSLKVLKRIKDQNLDYLSEAIDIISECYEAIGKPKEFLAYLTKVLHLHPDIILAEALAEHTKRLEGSREAFHFVSNFVKKNPSFKGFQLYVKLYLECASGTLKEDLQVLQVLSNKLLSDKPDYQCHSCGFSAKTLNWLCPGCKQWSTMKLSVSVAS